MSKFLVEKEIERLGEEIAALLQILDKNEGGGGFLQSGRSRQTLAEARDRAKKIQASEGMVSEQVRSLQAVLDGIRDGIVLLDREGKILLFNSAAERLIHLQSTDQTLDQWLRRYKFFDSDSKSVMHDLQTPFVKSLGGTAYADEPIYFQEKDQAGAKVNSLNITTIGNGEPKRSIVTVIIAEASETQNITHKLELLNASVQELKEGILVIDEAGSFLLLNNAAKRLLLTDKPQGRVDEWLKSHIICSDELGNAMLAERNPFVRAMLGERFQDVPVVVRRQDSSQSVSLKVTARSLAGKGKTKSKVAAVVVHELEESTLPDPAALEDLRTQLNENMQQLNSLSGMVAERDEKVRELNQQISEITQREYDMQRVSDTRVKVLEQQKTREQLKALEHQQMLEQQRAIRFAVTKVLGEAISLSEVAPTLMQEICGTLGWSMGFIWELDETLQFLRRLDLWQVPKSDFVELIKWSRAVKFAYGEGLPGLVMQSRVPIWMESIPSDDPMYEAAMKCDLHSAFAFPIFSGSRITGVMQFLSERGKPSDGELKVVFQDISKQLSQFSEGKRAEEQRAQLTAIVETSEDAIVFVSLTGNILRWNKGAGLLFGHSVESMRGKPFSAIVTPAAADLANENIRRCKRGERVERCELACVTKDGGPVTVSALFAPVMSLDGGVTGISVMARPLVEVPTKSDVRQAAAISMIEANLVKLEELTAINDKLKEKEAEIQRLNVEMETQSLQLSDMKKELDESIGKLTQFKDESNATDRFKSLFFSTVGREIRSPIESILSLSDQLAKASSASEELRDYAHLIHDSGAVISNVVNDIIEITKIEDGELALEIADFSLIGCLEQAAETVASRASHKRLSLLTYVSPDVPSLLSGDRLRLMQVISKLTDLVVTVTERGGVILRASLLKSEANEATVRIAFSDTGSGVSSQAAKKAIHELAQSTDSDKAMSDVGLRVVRRLVQLMKGEIAIDVGGVAMFSLIVTLPISKNVLEQITVDDSVKNSRLLVIEGPTGVSRVANAYCFDWGVQCDGAVTGDEALATLKRQKKNGKPYNIVLMERVMFGMNGFELAAAIKDLPELQDTKLILFNPYGDQQSEPKEHASFARIIRGPMSQSLFLKHLSALTEQDAGTNRSNAGGTTLSFALEQLALGQGPDAMKTRAARTHKSEGDKSSAGSAESQSSAGEAVVDIATARASMVKKAKKNTKQSLPSLHPNNAAAGTTSGASQNEASLNASASSTGVTASSPSAESGAGLSEIAGIQTSSQTSTAVAEASAEPPDFIDIQGLRRICGDSGMVEIIQEFMATAEKLLRQISVAVENGDGDDCRRLATELKASAGALGAKQIIELTDTMQNLPEDESHKNKTLYRSLQHSFDGLKAWILPQLEKSG